MANPKQNTESSFNEDFCIKLELQICEELKKFNDSKLKGFWCDGILWKLSNDAQLNKKNINGNRKIITKAWIGKTGQTEYELTIHFGKSSFRKFNKGIDLSECIPTENPETWIEIDTKKRTLDIKLK